MSGHPEGAGFGPGLWTADLTAAGPEGIGKEEWSQIRWGDVTALALLPNGFAAASLDFESGPRSQLWHYLTCPDG